MTWNYRVARCKLCRCQSVTSTALGNPLCAVHAADPDGWYYSDAAEVAWEKIWRLIGLEAARVWFRATIPDVSKVTWQQIAKIDERKLAELLPSRQVANG